MERLYHSALVLGWFAKAEGLSQDGTSLALAALEE